MIALEIESVLAVRARENQGTRNDLFQFVEKGSETKEGFPKTGNLKTKEIHALRSQKKGAKSHLYYSFGLLPIRFQNGSFR